MRKDRTLRLLSLAASFGTGTWTATDIGIELAGYGVPLTLTVGCALTVCASVTTFGTSVADALTTATYRCPAPGCSFKAQVRHASPGMSRRWQEIAAAHPGHELSRRGT
ncbi:hypothetical protein [Streptomyces orinoci]|uniref:Uncharacterized protein n=1 Tax=Streptomyces orinoci TaxID=67339 RepID=A0ABV3JPU4_STRON|nr:hypothetical protein [Streptomyces orinoci]